MRARFHCFAKLFFVISDVFPVTRYPALVSLNFIVPLEVLICPVSIGHNHIFPVSMPIVPDPDFFVSRLNPGFYFLPGNPYTHVFGYIMSRYPVLVSGASSGSFMAIYSCIVINRLCLVDTTSVVAAIVPVRTAAAVVVVIVMMVFGCCTEDRKSCDSGENLACGGPFFVPGVCFWDPHRADKGHYYCYGYQLGLHFSLPFG